LIQQPFPRPFHQQQVTGALANVVFSHFLDFFGVELNLFLAEFGVPSGFEQARIERFRLPRPLQVVGQLPRLEDLLDLGDECRDLGPEVGVGLGSFQEVQELLADEVLQRLLRAEFVLDALSSFALFDPNLVEPMRRRFPFSARKFSYRSASSAGS
jgi:hypothetical protein